MPNLLDSSNLENKFDCILTKEFIEDYTFEFSFLRKGDNGYYYEKDKIEYWFCQCLMVLFDNEIPQNIYFKKI